MSNVSSGSEPSRGHAPPALIGHAVPVRILGRALQSGRVPNAYLFHGPAGVGKATTARLFAAAVQCAALRGLAGTPEHPGLQACGACESCRRVAAGTHPDVIDVEPD